MGHIHPSIPHQIVFMTLLFAGLTVHAQENSNARPLLSAPVNWVLPDTPSAFDALWQTMDSLLYQGTGELSVLHMGGSHVQAGWMGHSVRNRWAKIAPKCHQSKGLMLPYRMAQTNTPTHFRTEFTGLWESHRAASNSDFGPFGGTGLRAETSDGNSTWQHHAFGPDSALFESQTVILWGDANGCLPIWIGKGPAKRLALPDQSGWQFELDSPVDTLVFGLEPLPEVPLSWRYYGMNALKKSPSGGGFTYHEWGHNGARIDHALRCSSLPNLWHALNPDIIFIGFGINDIQGPPSQWNAEVFQSEYDSLIQWVQAESPHSAIVLLTNTDSYRRNAQKANELALEVQHVMLRLAEQNQVGCYDLWTAMGGLGSIAEWESHGLAQKDRIHFTAEGYEALSNLLVDAWMSAYEEQSKSPFHSQSPAP